MESITEVLGKTDTLTFDCYGTLIDWESGLMEALAELLGGLPEGRETEVIDAYIGAEAAVEAETYKPYRDVMAQAAEEVAGMFNVQLPRGASGKLAESLPNWRPFPDSNAALKRLKGRCRLGVLSNVDRDLFRATARHFEIEFDFVITAEDVHAYKPSHLHFHHLVNAHNGGEGTVHVAQSLFHDGVPTRQLGIPFVWINRRGQANDTEVRPIAEYPDLTSFAEATCK
jgi:2-haloalkanoic acid dehalogenase type II